MEEAQRGRVLLGGCVVSDDDPRAGCRHCAALLWGHGVFTIDGNLRVRLGVPSLRMEAMLAEDRSLWLSDASEVAVVRAADVDRLMVVGVLDLFDDAATLRRWAERRRLTFAGAGAGSIEAVTVDPHGLPIVDTAQSRLVLFGDPERFALHLLRDLVRARRLRTVDDLAAVLDGRGIALVRSPVPVG
jgi:hypothetical protein